MTLEWIVQAHWEPIMLNPYEINWVIDDDYEAVVDPTAITAAIERTLTASGCARATLTVALTHDEAVQALNRDYRGIDAPTDVLSFPSHEAGEEEGTALALPAELADSVADYLGDVVIAVPYAQRQAAHYANSLLAELRLLAVHGVLHLLGHDHDTPDRQAAMWSIQTAVLGQSGDEALAERTYKTDADDKYA